MTDEKSTRYRGQLIEWNDEKGYGFIQSLGQQSASRQPVFLHIKAFAQRGPRPLVGCMLEYQVTVDSRGRAQAIEVRYVRAASKAQAQLQKPQAASAAKLGGKSLAGWRYWLIMGYLAVIAALILTQRLPGWVIGVPVLVGTVTYYYYLIDKHAARSGHWRVQEGTLHLLALCGGWCGALVAQQHLRHKTIKTDFQQIFWSTVLLNWVLMDILAHTRVLG